MALNVPWIRSATKVGNATARNVSDVTRPIWLAARGSNRPASWAVASGPSSDSRRRITGTWRSFSDCQQMSRMHSAA